MTPRNPRLLGGVERHVLEVTRRLAAGGHEVKVLYADQSGEDTSERHDGVSMVPVRAWPAQRDWAFAPGLWAEMARGRWDLMHVQSYHTFVAPLAMARARSLGIPFVLTFHGGGHSSELRSRSRPVQLRALRPLLVHAKRLIAVARFEIDIYSRMLRLDRERFAYIPNGVDRAALDFGLEQPLRPVLASIGRLERYKGHDRVIEALPAVLAAEPAARLLIVGTGPYDAALRQLADRLGVADRVQFTSIPSGDANAMLRLLGGVSLVVLMSSFETHPLVGLEAAAARRRLLVADHAGLGELVREGLAWGISPTASSVALAGAIIERLASPAPDSDPALPTWDDCARQLLDVYHSVCGR